MTRLVSGVALAAAALAAILYLPVSGLRLLAIVVVIAAALEYGRVAGAAPGVSRFLLVFASALLCGLFARGVSLETHWLPVALLAWVMLEVLFLGRTLHQAGVGVIAPFYIGMPLGMLVALQADHGWQATLLLMATVVVSDSGQYYSGRAFGRRALAPSISPKKTMEGAVGGVLLGTAFMTVAGRVVFPGHPLGEWILLGLVVVVLGICGDLFESRLKRTAGIKDSSTLIPGHGGVLDRIDALLFAIPAFYLYMRSAS